MASDITAVVVSNAESRAWRSEWSPSALTTFIQCPLKYWWKYAQGWKEASTIHTAAGGIVHDILEDLLRQEPDLRTMDTAKDLYRIYLAAWKSRGQLLVQADEIATMVRDAVTTYFELEDPTTVEYLDDGLEFDVAGAIAGIPIAGRIDRLQYGLTGLRVVDYKSGKCKPQYVGDYWRQQTVYATLLTDQGLEIDEIELLYLGNPSRRMTRPVVPALTARVEADLVRAVAERTAFDETSTWQARPGRLCRWCPFQKACPTQGKRARPTPGTTQCNEILARIPELTRNPARAGDPDLVGDPEEA